MNITPLNITEIHSNLYPAGTRVIPIEELACIQMNEWMIHTGLTLLILYPLITWISWWYFNHGWKKWPYNNKIIGDVNRKENRIYWSVFIRDRFLKVCLGYIGILVYLALMGH